MRIFYNLFKYLKYKTNDNTKTIFNENLILN